MFNWTKNKPKLYKKVHHIVAIYYKEYMSIVQMDVQQNLHTKDSFDKAKSDIGRMT